MGCQFNIPIFAMILTATLVSTASSMGGGLILYFQGLESLEDSMSDTSAGELRSLRETIRNKLTNVEAGIDSLRRFIFSIERLKPGSLSYEWADAVRAYSYAQVAGSNGALYAIGMFVPPVDWTVNNGVAMLSYEESPGKTRTGTGAMIHGEFHEQLPKNQTILTPDGKLANVLAPMSVLDPKTGYKIAHLYNAPVGWLFNMPDPRLPRDDPSQFDHRGPRDFTDPPAANSVMSYWTHPSQWVFSQGVRYWVTYLRAIYMPPPFPHPLHRFKTVCLTLGIDFTTFQPPFDDYKQAHPDTVVLMADRQTGIVQASTILPMVPDWCHVGGGIGDYIAQGCALRLTNLSQAVQSGFRKSGEEPFGSFIKAELDGEDYFIRRVDLGFQNLELVWMRPTSSVQGKVQEALVLLILFTALVLCFDVTIMVMEVIFIAMPMRQLSSAIMSVGDMETEEANRSISMYRQRAVMLKEMRRLMEGMTATIGRLEEFRTFMPEAIFSSEPVLVGSQEQQEAPGSETGHAAVLFTDVQGSTHLWEACMEEMAEALRLHNTVIREVIMEHGGYEVKTIGDAFMISFPNIDTAVRFGLRTQERLFQAAWPAELLEVVQASGDEERGLRGLRVRVGVTHGAVNVDLNEVVRRWDYFGPTVNRAARLEANGVCGGVAVEASVVDSLTAVQQQQALVVQLGTRSLKGIGDIPLCLLVPESMPQRAAHAHDVAAPNPLRRLTQANSFASTCSGESHVSRSSRLVAVERFSSDKLSEVGSATTGFVDREVVDMPCAAVTATADSNLRGVVACLGRSDGRLLNVCGTAALVAWNVMAPCAGHLEAALRFASMMSCRAADGMHCGLSSGKVFSGCIATGKRRFVTAVGQCVQVSQRVHTMALQMEQVALFATKDTQVTGAMVAHRLATAAGELRKGAEVYTVCALLCDVVASRVDRKQDLFNLTGSAAKEDPDN